MIRIARPTNDIEAILRFYRDGLGLEVLDSFTDHAGFDGVMLGHAGEPFHFEFTRERGAQAPRAPSEDHLIVFYSSDPAEWAARVQRMTSAGFQPVPAHNPWWNARGKTFADSDGYRVVLALGA
ncbi:MAG TPA: VOC family protein [Myxococcales bacterium]|nr:VOC family protein [Myxococcales bacterium]